MGLTRDERVNISLSMAKCLALPQVICDALDDMLNVAEERFGPRDLSYSIVGVEFNGDFPLVSFPMRPDPYARIRLSAKALRWAEQGDLRYAFWQLAHESIHLLSPIPGQPVTVFEEGLACCFQFDYMQNYTVYETTRQSMPSYIEAETRMRRLLELNAQIVLKIRKCEPIISHISADTLRTFCPELLLEEVQALTDRFYRYGPPSALEKTWPFVAPKSTAVITTRSGSDGEGVILSVTRDAHDGVWQFLDESEDQASELNGEATIIVSLLEMVLGDHSIQGLADLPLGGKAWRNGPNDEWQRK